MNKLPKHVKGRNKKVVQTEKTPAASLDCTDPKQLENVQGLKKIEISPLTQTFVGCRVGKNITTDNSWVFIEKEKIEDHLEFYEENSEFYPICEDIKKMPKKELLIGTNNYIQDDKIEFYICLSIEVQERILAAVEKEKRRLRQKILNSFYPKTRKWKSLGSEVQVDSELNKSTRPLFIIDLESCLPFQKQKIRFKVQNVENILDGYIELVTTRSSFNLVMRKRMDIGIQFNPVKKNIGVQTMNQTVSNKNIQYSFEYEDCEIPDKVLVNLREFILDKLKQFGDVLKLNFSLDLYQDDYSTLRKTSIESMEIASEIKSYQDVIKCRRRKISCFTWNAILAGVVAAGHAVRPFFCTEKSRPTLDTVLDTIFRAHLVLIWYYNDNVRPKFYLHATREITAISFCPYNENILVAGYNNGQIAVWDLTGKLNCSKPKEFLNDIQQKNHILINELTSWFKRCLSDKHVFPVLCSALEVGHKSAVTAIKWIPPSKYIALQRAYRDSQENEPHMQFVTASVDGQRILVWDLHIADNQEQLRERNRLNRLSRKPATLIDNDSPLVALKNKFQPVCQLITKHLSFPVINLLIQDKLFNYKARNPETIDDIDQLTYYIFTEKKKPFDYSQKLMFTTGIGTFHEATWEATDYDPKFYAVNEKCQIEKFPDIHDGPIFVCESNPYLDDVILTIGGSVIAIWYVSKIRLPIFWRKSNIRYVTGMWTLLHPLSFLAVRNDAYYELWNILERSEIPIQVLKYKGYKIIKVYKDIDRSHARKKTCVVTDTLGAFKLYTVPSEYMELKIDANESLSFLEHLVKVKETVSLLKQNFCKKQIAQVEVVEPERVQAPVAAPEETLPKKEVPLTNKIKWELKLEKNMRKIIYEKKKINLKELADNKPIVEQTFSEENAKQNKVKERISNREAIFKKAGGHFFDKQLQKTRHSTFKCDVKAVKEAYMSDYLKIEEKVLDAIRLTDHCFQFNWFQLLRRRSRQLSY